MFTGNYVRHADTVSGATFHLAPLTGHVRNAKLNHKLVICNYTHDLVYRYRDADGSS